MTSKFSAEFYLCMYQCKLDDGPEFTCLFQCLSESRESFVKSLVSNEDNKPWYEELLNKLKCLMDCLKNETSENCYECCTKPKEDEDIKAMIASRSKRDVSSLKLSNLDNVKMFRRGYTKETKTNNNQQLLL